MSVADIATTTPPPVAPQPPPVPARRGLSAVGAWVRVALACAVLLGSAGLRSWQARRIQGEMAEGLRRPRIDLALIPEELGRWKGESTSIDEQIARGTGADQIVTRRYVNQDTGVKVDVILLYGPAVEMYIHAPELCYPAAGFKLAAGPDAKTIDYDMRRYQDGKAPKAAAGAAPEVKQASFRSLVYTKGEGALAAFQEVYYAWRYHDRWTPDAGLQKHFERIPSMYKVHLARPVGPKERREIGNPCESLLKELLPQIEGRIAANAAPRA